MTGEKKGNNIFISYSGTRMDPVKACFNDLNVKYGIRKSYLLYNIHEDNGLKSDDCCFRTAKYVWQSYTSEETETFRAGAGNETRIYFVKKTEDKGKKKDGAKEDKVDSEVERVVCQLMPDKTSFDFDTVHELVNKIYTENDKGEEAPNLYVNITNGSKPFVAALTIAAYTLGGHLFYVDLNEGVKEVKHCPKTDVSDLSLGEKRLLACIGLIIDNEYGFTVKSTSASSGNDPNFSGSGKKATTKREKAYSSTRGFPQKLISQYSELMENAWRSKDGIITVNKDGKANYCGLSWKKLSPQYVSSYVPDLHKRGLIKINGESYVKEYKAGTKEKLVTMTASGRKLFSEMKRAEEEKGH